ncbi:MAG: DUF3619 family protein [Pseudomonadota bacterium]|nr:DUF3619 family protein [Pseudomonadota bacterium]
MTTHDDEFARKVTGYLDQGTASLRAGTAYRLQLARQRALARLSPDTARSPALSGALAGVGGGMGGSSPRDRSTLANGRLWVAVGLLAVATFGYEGYRTWQAHQTTNELVETDVGILTSDLPIDAYLDRGFQNWLKHLDDR